MKILPECYLCAMRQALGAARLVSDDMQFHNEVMARTAGLLAESPRDIAPPEGGEMFYRMIRELSGRSDPFREMKLKQNEVVSDLLPWLRDTVAAADDSLLMAVRLAIAGNAVDPGAQESFELEKSVMEAVAGEVGLEVYPEFRNRLEESRRVLVIADNCGEILFDRVLIETMLAGREIEVVLAVRGGPIINDVTMVEARELGLGELSELISTGLEMPGTVLERATPEFRQAFHEADLVISKGQGNWETLEEEGREIFFMFQAKCPAVAAFLGCPEGHPLLLKSEP